MKIEIPSQRKVISTYGNDAQAMVHMEECSELIQAISKMRRVKNSGADDCEAYYNLVEEMADVLICLEQLQETYDIFDSEIQSMVYKKCRRQEARLHDFHDLHDGPDVRNVRDAHVAHDVHDARTGEHGQEAMSHDAG